MNLHTHFKPPPFLELLLCLMVMLRAQFIGGTFSPKLRPSDRQTSRMEYFETKNTKIRSVVVWPKVSKVAKDDLTGVLIHALVIEQHNKIRCSFCWTFQTWLIILVIFWKWFLVCNQYGISSLLFGDTENKLWWGGGLCNRSSYIFMKFPNLGSPSFNAVLPGAPHWPTT